MLETIVNAILHIIHVNQCFTYCEVYFILAADVICNHIIHYLHNNYTYTDLVNMLNGRCNWERGMIIMYNSYIYIYT